MATTALVLYLVWTCLAFGLRTAIQRRRTGDSGLRLGAGPPGTPEWWARLTFVLALVLGLLAPIAARAGLVEPLAALDDPAVAYLGLMLVVLGGLGTFVVQGAMGDSWRIGVDESERTALVTGGPFSVVRNPIFSAMAVTAVGFALMVPSVIALTGLALLALALELQVRAVEEPYLRRVHGEAYARYAARVGRFVPGIGCDRAGQPGGAGAKTWTG